MAGTVVVTGASAGIGEAAALRLRELGFDVVGGVRRAEDAVRLQDLGLRTAILDVTDAAQVRAIAEDIGDAPLAGLVNNAGIAVAAPVEFLPIEMLRRQLEVNLIGQIAVTQALLPALRRARGRIVNVSSIGGRVAVPLLSPYAASKFGLEGFSDSLRRELRPHGVRVVLVEPGGVKTQIWRKGGEMADTMMEQVPPEAEGLYGDLVRVLRAQSERIDRESGMDASEVADVIARAMTSRRPRTRYLVGSDAKLRARVAWLLPDRAMDALIARALRG
jgi:NAD(P)-dependent dehydrogenase (short-subunit alcohol dehydrogenase family)